MLHLRAYIGILLLWLVLFFNIERLDEQINFVSFIYLYVPFLAGSVIFFPRLMGRGSTGHRRLFIAVVLAIYLLLKRATGSEILGGTLPLTITEVSSVLVTVYISHKISLYVHDFEETIANLTFKQIGLPPRLYESTDTEDLYRELKRCRRFQHPLSMLIISPKFDPKTHRPKKLLREMQDIFAARYVQARLAKLFSDGLRDTDLVVVQNNKLIALLPETAMEDARIMLENKKNQAKDELGLDFIWGLSGFPENAITLNGLMDFAQGDLEEKKHNDES